MHAVDAKSNIPHRTVRCRHPLQSDCIDPPGQRCEYPYLVALHVVVGVLQDSRFRKDGSADSEVLHHYDERKVLETVHSCPLHAALREYHRDAVLFVPRFLDVDSLNASNAKKLGTHNF